MKRLLAAALLMALLLVGCVEAPQDTTAQPTTESLPTEPALYQPGSELEQLTEGAVRVYQLNVDKGGDILNIGSDLLVFAYGEDTTTLTRLTDSGRPIQTTQLSGRICPDGNAVRIDNNTLAYYDPADCSIVFLDGMLQQTERISLPEDMIGAPVLSADLKLVYYASDDQVRKLELDTGISSLLRMQEMELFQPVALAASDQALECLCIDPEGNAYTEYISTAKGQTLATVRDIELTTQSEHWFAILTDGTASEYLFGSGDEIKALYPRESYDSVVLLGNKAMALLAAEDGLQADLFDLDNGYRCASVTFPGICEADSMTMSADGTDIWFIASDGQQNLLCSWEFSKSATGDQSVYTGSRYTPDHPDELGLQQAEQRMADLSERFQVDLKFWDAAQSREGFLFQKEYRGTAVNSVLDTLEKTFAIFPDGFFSQLEEGKLSIEILHSISVLAEDAPQAPASLVYWENGHGHIVLTVSEDPGAAFCSALSRVLDAYIFSNSLAYDEWDRLNPSGFAYDLTYSLYADRQDGKWLSGADRAFVNELSKTFAREDRASIFVSAMEEGNEDMFASRVMQKKLQCICKAIREAFGWKKDERTFIWEQYLQ